MEDAMVAAKDEPSLQEALEGDEWCGWKDVIEAKLTQIKKLCTWDLVIPSPSANLSTPSSENAMRMAKSPITRCNSSGFKQQFFDYIETYAPTVCPHHTSHTPILHSPTQCHYRPGWCKKYIPQCTTSEQSGNYMQLPPKYANYQKLPPNLENEPVIVSSPFMGQNRDLMISTPNSEEFS